MEGGAARVVAATRVATAGALFLRKCARILSAQSVLRRAAEILTMRSMNLVTRVASFFCLAGLAGCAAAMGTDKTLDLETEILGADLADGDDAADGYTRALVSRGAIGFGETIDSSFATDGYFGWTFTVAAGARITLDAVPVGDADTVIALYGPMTGRTWSRARPVAVNDDYRGTLASHIDARAVRAGTYLMIVRDY